MPRRDRDYEPGRVKKGSPRARWFFEKLGIMSARRKREKEEENREAYEKMETADEADESDDANQYAWKVWVGDHWSLTLSAETVSDHEQAADLFDFDVENISIVTWDD